MRIYLFFTFCLLFIFPKFFYGQNFNKKSYTIYTLEVPYAFFRNEPTNKIVDTKIKSGLIGNVGLLYVLREKLALETSIFFGYFSYKWKTSYEYMEEENYEKSLTGGIPIRLHFLTKKRKKHFYSFSAGINYNFIYKSNDTFSVGIDSIDFIKGKWVYNYKPQIALNLTANYFKLKKNNKLLNISIIYQLGFVENIYCNYRIEPYTNKEIRGKLSAKGSYIGFSFSLVIPNKLFSN